MIVSGTNLLFSGSGGLANGTYSVLSSTNVALPITDWLAILTNQFDCGGNFSFTNSPSQPQTFFLLRVP